MPHTHIRSFRVRYYECDAYGHLNNTNYVRYMQEAAFAGSRSAGYNRQRYKDMNRLWVIRSTEVEFLRPVLYNDCLQVKTWVGDFRRATSRRMYEITHAESGALVARGFSDWVYLNLTTGRPAAVEPEVQQAFFPEGVPDRFPPRQPFPSLPEPPAGVFSLRMRAAWRDIDPAGHLNNANYLSYIEECGLQAVAAHNWPVDRMASAGFGIMLRKLQVQYLQPAFLDDELEISTWVSGVRRSSAIRHYTIRRVTDGVLLAQAHTLGAWVELESGRLVRIPSEMLDDFAPNISA
jgi:acyl-CoA thioester hydrolase